MTADDLEEHGAETGLVLEFNRGSTPPAKIPPNQIPTGLDRLGQKAAANIKQISGITDSMLGQDSAEVSGVAIQQKQNRGSMLLQVPLTNLAKTRQYLAEAVLRLVQTYYTEERVIQVTDNEDPYKPRRSMRVNQMDAAGEIVNNLQLGEYDVVVSQAPARDNFDEMQFAEAISLRQVGVPIPDDMIVEYSHLSRKADVADRIRKMQGTAPKSPEQIQLQKFQMESQIRSTQLEIAKLEAEVATLQTSAALNAAKVEQIETEPELKIAELQSKIQTKREELGLRERLSELTNQMRKDQSDTAAASKMAVEALRNLDKTGGTPDG